MTGRHLNLEIQRRAFLDYRLSFSFSQKARKVKKYLPLFSFGKSAKYQYVMSKAGVRPSKRMEGEGDMSSRT